MPRLTRTVPKLSKKTVSGKTYAVVTVAGRTHFLGTWNTRAAHAEYDRVVAEWLASGRPSRPEPAAEDATITDLCAAFWKWAKGYYNATTADHYRRVLKALRATYGQTLTADFSPLALKALRDEFVRGGATRNYANQFARQIKFVFKWGVSEDLVPPDVLARLNAVAGLRKGKTDARESTPVPPVDLDVFEATIAYLPGTLADLLRLQLLTGARPGEIAELKPGLVDTAGEIWEYRPARHKTEHHGRSRIIFIGPKGQDVLRPYLLRPADQRCFRPVDSEKKRRRERTVARKTPESCGNTVGTNRKMRPKRKPGEAYGKDAINRAVRRAVERLNADRAKDGLEPVERWSPNQLRHSAATLLRKEFGLEAAQVILGHSRADVTQVYAERDAAKARDVMREIG